MPIHSDLTTDLLLVDIDARVATVTLHRPGQRNALSRALQRDLRAAVTGGFELALASDFLVASERASFADTHARVGVMPGWGLTALLPEAIGVRRAREMSVTGNYLDARTAAEWGLVNHVVAHDELLPFCHGLAADIVSNDRDGVRQMLDTYQQVVGRTPDDARSVEATISARWMRERHDPAAVEERRRGIVERGRSQQG